MENKKLESVQIKFKDLEESNSASLKRHLKFYMTMNEMLPN